MYSKVIVWLWNYCVRKNLVYYKESHQSVYVFRYLEVSSSSKHRLDSPHAIVIVML